MKHLKIIILFFSLFLHPINGGIGDVGDPFGNQPQSSQQPAETNQNPQWETIHGFASLLDNPIPINNYALHLQRPQQPAETHPLSQPTHVGPFTSLFMDDTPKENYGLRLNIPQYYVAPGVQFRERVEEKPKSSILGKRDFEEINSTEKGKQIAGNSENAGSRRNQKFTRARYNSGQISILNEYYQEDKYCDSIINIKSEIVDRTGLTPNQVKNKRMQDKRTAKSQQVQSQNEELEELRSQNHMLQQKVQELLHTVNIQQQQLLQYHQLFQQHVSQQFPNPGAVNFDRMGAPFQPQEHQQHEQLPQDHA